MDRETIFSEALRRQQLPNASGFWTKFVTMTQHFAMKSSLSWRPMTLQEAFSRESPDWSSGKRCQPMVKTQMTLGATCLVRATFRDAWEHSDRIRSSNSWGVEAWVWFCEHTIPN